MSDLSDITGKHHSLADEIARMREVNEVTGEAMYQLLMEKRELSARIANQESILRRIQLIHRHYPGSWRDTCDVCRAIAEVEWSP